MKLGTDKWRRHLVVFTALVVVATGLAATPLRKSITPFVTKPLGSWSLPVPRSTGQATEPTAYVPSSAAATTATTAIGTTVGTAAELGVTPALPDSTIAPNNAGLIELGDVTEHGGSGAASGDSNGREGGGWNLSGSRFGGSLRLGRSGQTGGFSYAGRPAFSGSGSIGRANPAGGSRAGSGGGSGGANGHGPIFNDHKWGFPELTGRKNGAFGGGGAGGGSGSSPRLASNPEPSTLLLFGTGLVTAVGTIRRRLRRQ